MFTHYFLNIILFTSFLSCTSNIQLTRGQIIDKMIKDLPVNLPYDFNNGIVWTSCTNESNIRKVNSYMVSEDGIHIVKNQISKNQIINQLKSIPNGKGFKLSKEHSITNIWRYYHDKNLIKEITIYPNDW